MGTIRKPRRLAAVMATLILAATLGTITVTQQTANAATWRNCISYDNVLCLYNWVEGPVYPAHDHWANNLGRFSLNIPARQCIPFPSHIDNHASSAFLNGAQKGVRVVLFERPDCNRGLNVGRKITLVGPSGQIGNLNWVRVPGGTISMNDRLSSFWID